MGRRILTLRMVAVRVAHLPMDAATAVATGASGWIVSDYLLADCYAALAGQTHPARPKHSSASIPDPAREQRLRRARARQRARERAIAAGEIS